MKNIKLIIPILFLGLVLFAGLAFAEDDNESDRENNYQAPVPVVAPVATPVVTPVVIPVISEPVTSTISSVPSPQVTEINKLIDSDDDVIDSLDKYAGEDDFAFSGQDANNNGILDELEYLLNR